MKIDYLLTGIVNGKYLEVKGLGETCEENGGYKIEFNSIIAPEGWDPGIVIMICCGNFTFYSCKFNDKKIFSEKKELLPLKLSNLVARKGTLSNENGEYIVGMQARGFLWQEGDILYSRSVIIEGFSSLDKYGGIKSIENFTEEIIPSVKNHATGLTTYVVHTNNGEKLYGEAYFPYTFENFDLKERVKINGSNINSGYSEFVETNRKRTSISVTVTQQE